MRQRDEERVSRWATPLIALGIIAAAALFTFRPTYDPDLFWHIAQGEHDLRGTLVRTNLFSAAHANYPQHYTSYGFEILQAMAVRIGGLAGVQVLSWILLSAALLMLYAAARTKGSRAAAGAALLLALFVVEPRAMPRPYVISFIGFAGLAALAAVRSGVYGPWSSVRIPLVIALWSNFHSESAFGVAFVVLATLPDAPWNSMVSTVKVAKLKLWVLSASATLATPYGIGLWRYLYENTAVPTALRIAELEPPTLEAYPAFFAYLAIVAIAAASAPRRLRLPDLAILVVFTALGLRYIRFMPMIVFVAAPMLADRIQYWMDRGWDRRAVLATVAAVMCVTAPASPLRMMRAWKVGEAALAPPEFFSTDAIEFIRANEMKGPMFNSMNLGGYLDWQLGGGTFIDSRLQAAPRAAFVALTEAAAEDEKWKAMLEGYNVAVVSLARPSDISGVGKFNAPEWIPVFRDQSTAIYVRKNQEP